MIIERRTGSLEKNVAKKVATAFWKQIMAS
jgi:hypothetical protein